MTLTPHDRLTLTLPREIPRPTLPFNVFPKLHRHAIHAYHNVQPWSQDERYFVYTSVDSHEQGYVVVHDLASGQGRVVCDRASYNFHTGAGVRWILDDTAVVFRATPEDGTAGSRFGICDLQSGDTHYPDHWRSAAIRQVYDRGRMATATITVAGRVDLVLLDLQTHQHDTLVTSDSMATVLNGEYALSPDQIDFSHPLLSPDHNLLYMKIMRSEGGAKKFHCVLVYDRQADRFHMHGEAISGHPIWDPRIPVIYNVSYPRDGSDNRHLIQMDPISGDYERLIDTPVEGPSHLEVTPDGRWLIADAFTADQMCSPIYAIDLQTRACRELIRLHHRYEAANYLGFYRAQPHPAISPSGRQLAVNCNGGSDAMDILVLDLSRLQLRH